MKGRSYVLIKTIDCPKHPACTSVKNGNTHPSFKGNALSVGASTEIVGVACLFPPSCASMIASASSCATPQFMNIITTLMNNTVINLFIVKQGR